MIGKINNLSFLLILMIFSMNFCFFFSLSLNQQEFLIKPNNQDIDNNNKNNTQKDANFSNNNEYLISNNMNYNKNLILLDEKIQSLNNFLENIVQTNIYNFFEKSIQKELTKNEKKYSDENNIDSSIFSQLSSNVTNSNLTLAKNKEFENLPIPPKKEESNTNNNITTNSTKNEMKAEPEKKEEEKKTPDPELLKEEPKKEEIVETPVSSDESSIKKDLESRKAIIDKIKYSSDDVKDKTNRILDFLKDIDEKQTKLISNLKNLITNTENYANEKYEQQIERSNKLQKEIDLQKRNAVDIKDLYKKTSDLLSKIQNVDYKSREIANSLSTLTDEFKNVKFKIYADKIDSDKKMFLINKKLTQQLKIMFTTQILDSQKQANAIQDTLKEYNSRIKTIKSRLPQTDNVCSLLTNCGSCTSNPNCGWCSMSQECVPGSKDGPSNGQCSFFDYGSCGGPRECGSYNNCGDCLKDISCGWCNAPGNQRCMERNLADEGKCSQDQFIHLWRSLNICPHDKIQSKEATFEITKKSVLDNEDKNASKIPLIDPITKKKLIDELKYYQKEVSDNEAKLNSILSAIANMKKELVKLNDNPNNVDDFAGINHKIEKTEEEINKDFLKKSKEKKSVISSGENLLKELDSSKTQISKKEEKVNNQESKANTDTKTSTNQKTNDIANNIEIKNNTLSINQNSGNYTASNTHEHNNNSLINSTVKDLNTSNRTIAHTDSSSLGKNDTGRNEQINSSQNNKTLTLSPALNKTSFVQIDLNKYKKDQKNNLRARASIII